MQGNAGTGAKIFRRIEFRTDKLVVFTARLAQETATDFQRVSHRAIEPAGLDVEVHLILRVIGHHFNAFGLELAQSVFLLRAGFQYANFLAFDGGRTIKLDVFLQDDLAGRVVVLVGEIDLFEALFGNRHGTDDDIVFLGQQTRNHAVPSLLDEHAFALDLLAQRIGNVNVKAGGLAFGGFVGKGFIGRVNGHFEVFALGKGRGAQGAHGRY
ncbi:hypothetical protein GALL_486200 [mine drainage metagenome]|uniref:Uncharacterized protein n=1 Tax=mine drainage metagenome TaxID=410659 RepID=A0A1J5PPT9_9ZZZZ